MAKMLIPETMTRFKCNEKGCCCRGWGIPFPPDDVGRLLMAFEPDEREGILEGAQADVNPQGELTHLRLRQVGPDKACQFVMVDGRCGVHATKGPEVLPHLCRAFPTFAHQAGETVELHFDAVCPEVLERLDADDGPFKLVEIDVQPGEDLAVRAQRTLKLPEIVFGERAVRFDELTLIRGRILEALNSRQRPALRTLGLINHALWRVMVGQPPEGFALDDADPPEAFEAFFERCLYIHEDRLLARIIEDYRPFIHAIDLGDADVAQLAPHLAVDPAWRQHLDPESPTLQPLITRYLSHRFFSAFDRSPSANRLSFTYGTINHCLAVGFRIAVGLSQWLGRPVDRDVLKVGLGASEYAFRVFRVPQWSMPWFGLESVREQEGEGT